MPGKHSHWYKKMRFIEMRGKRQKPRIPRKTFDKVIAEARADFYNDEAYLNPEMSFHVSETPNRNPEQVVNGLWYRLLYKHVNKIYYS